ncbi:hypothetical protein B566_EDAN013043 [Ephemera danica]|nr:hypothetical protein B566_EDAN013043 [Ephemera danica]
MNQLLHRNYRISSLVAYLLTVSAITAWLLNILLEEFVKFSNPLPLPTIKYYIIRARQIGLLTDEIATTFLREPREEQSFGTYANFDTGSDNESHEQQMRAEMQCEVELLLNELHRLLVASWFDSVSPKDPDFPRATRQALAKVALELQARAGSIKPTEATRIALLLLISHLNKIKKKSYQNSSPIEDGSAKQLLELISEALISFLAWPDVSSKLGGKLLSSLLAHGALLRALNVVSSPGWLSLQIAQAITGESTVYKPINTTNLCNEAQPTEVDESTVNVEVNQADIEAESAVQADIEAESAVQEACTPADDIPDFLEWSSDLPGHGPRLWGPSSQQSHVSQQAEQPSVPQIIEHGVDTRPSSVTRKASEAEWLNPSPPRQQLGLQLSKSSQDLRQVAAVQYPVDDMKSIKKELSLGSFVREETSILSHRVREAGCDVLGSLRARATSHLSALLSPAREMSVPPAGNTLVAESLLEPGEGEEEVSPVYEEASDLATSIAKLRALLQHHDPKSSSEEDDMVAIQPGEVETQPEQRPVWDIQQDGDVSDSEWMEAEEAPELPNDGRMIMNVRIPATELSCDTTGQQFVQYCIQRQFVFMMQSTSRVWILKVLDWCFKPPM